MDGWVEITRAEYAKHARRVLKGASHKYLKRVATVDAHGRTRYRDFYRVTSGHALHAHDDIRAKSAYRGRDGEHVGHWHVVSRDGDTVEVRHDVSGKVETVPVAKFAERVERHNAAAVAEHGMTMAKRAAGDCAAVRKNYASLATRLAADQRYAALTRMPVADVVKAFNQAFSPSPHVRRGSSLEDAEAAIRGEPLEHGAVLRRGAVVWSRTSSSRDLVAVTDAEIAEMAESGAYSFTHNHPSDGPPSRADIAMAVRANLAELRAVTSAGVFSVRRTGKSWPRDPTFMDRVEDAYQIAGAVASATTGTDEEWMRELARQVLDLVSQALGVHGSISFHPR